MVSTNCFVFPAVCQGVTNRLNLLGSKDDHYLNMVKTYSNCTVVLENLEITHMEEHRDLSFLKVTEKDIFSFLTLWWFSPLTGSVFLKTGE